MFSAKKYNINTSKSVLIGDRLSDMMAGCKSEIHTLMHVKPGHGEKEYKKILTSCDKDNFLIDQKNQKLFSS